MSEPFIAEIRIFAGNFAPRGWAFCNGQLLPIAQNTALFSLIGTTYGGDGRTTTALPDLQGRFPMHPGRGPGLTDRRLGERGGASTVALAQAQLPAHGHALQVASGPGASGTPSDAAVLAATGGPAVYGPASDLVPMSDQAVAPVGEGAGHENRHPWLALQFIIALVGLFPSRS